MISINLIEHNNYDGTRLTRLNNVLDVVGQVLNGDAFKQAVLAFTTDGEPTFYYRRTIFGRPIDTPHTNQEVFDMIMAGVENPGDAAPDSMDLYLTLINGSDGDVIGYGNPGTKEIFTYSVMFDSMTVPELINHYTHEWCHKLGFNHSFQRNRLRNYSVPYGVGNIAEKIADGLV